MNHFAALPAGRALFPIPRQRDMARFQVRAAVDDALDAMAKAWQVFLSSGLIANFLPADLLLDLAIYFVI